MRKIGENKTRPQCLWYIFCFIIECIKMKMCHFLTLSTTFLNLILTGHKKHFMTKSTKRLKKSGSFKEDARKR